MDAPVGAVGAVGAVETTTTEAPIEGQLKTYDTVQSERLQIKLLSCSDEVEAFVSGHVERTGMTVYENWELSVEINVSRNNAGPDGQGQFCD